MIYRLWTKLSWEAILLLETLLQYHLMTLDTVVLSSHCLTSPMRFSIFLATWCSFLMHQIVCCFNMFFVESPMTCKCLIFWLFWTVLTVLLVFSRLFQFLKIPLLFGSVAFDLSANIGSFVFLASLGSFITRIFNSNGVKAICSWRCWCCVLRLLLVYWFSILIQFESTRFA